MRSTEKRDYRYNRYISVCLEYNKCIYSDNDEKLLPSSGADLPSPEDTQLTARAGDKLIPCRERTSSKIVSNEERFVPKLCRAQQIFISQTSRFVVWSQQTWRGSISTQAKEEFHARRISAQRLD
ncbi:predicted protein [Uncinocarpus reesii 1704]|uniref:Uncharacterized protein n=1 Tax=Uncinocarpus reesii (strain UAMH 1704) TaxID=336963 RepID=C4JHM3_UNCRE|nr:uncharacterized protein UREG_02709 [Uncinocarpus reesii 1704]EEP77860.1 predicted protein [Uncinocarpus reesii 1704]